MPPKLKCHPLKCSSRRRRWEGDAWQAASAMPRRCTMPGLGHRTRQATPVALTESCRGGQAASATPVEATTPGLGPPHRGRGGNGWRKVSIEVAGEQSLGTREKKIR
jgi:hypothetical protein